jgi:hypothetical protein
VSREGDIELVKEEEGRMVGFYLKMRGKREGSI